MSYPRCESIDQIQDALLAAARAATWDEETRDDGTEPRRPRWVRTWRARGWLTVMVPWGVEVDCVTVRLPLYGAEMEIAADTDARDRYSMHGWDVLSLRWTAEGSRPVDYSELRDDDDRGDYLRDTKEDR